MSFTSLLVAVGKGFGKGLQWAVEYAVPTEKLVGLLFPSAAPAVTELADATTLIQHAVLLVEQKYAAAGAQNGTGPQKLAEVVLLSGQAITGLLSKAGITPDSGYVSSLISAVVAILNVQAAPAVSTAAIAAS